MQNPKNFIKQQLDRLYPPAEIEALSRLILEKEFGLSFADILTGKFNDLSAADRQKLEKIVERLRNFEPLQYVLGETEFFGMDFWVSPSVLIPRPETEELVLWIKDSVDGNLSLKLLDIGVGSGCIAVSLAKMLPRAQVFGWDVSAGALQIARKNADRHAVNVVFAQKNMLQDVAWNEKLDVIVSNPPYIAESEKSEMEKNVLDFEPHLALFVPDNNPLIFYEKIANFALQHLNSGGMLFFEINRAKGDEIKQMLLEKGFLNVELRKDISGNNRMIKARI